MIRVIIAICNKNHMALPELRCVVRERARSMPIAPDVNDPEYWHKRAEEARVLAERMIDETAKETMLSVAEECDEFAVTAAILHFDKLFVGRLIRETKGS